MLVVACGDHGSGGAGPSSGDPAAANAASPPGAASAPSAAGPPGATSEPPASGAQVPALDLPFAYSLTAGGLVIHTDGGDVDAIVGSWGSHFVPNGGKPWGDAKSNISVVFTHDACDPTSTAPGACELPESAFAGKVPKYIAPAAATIDSVAHDPPSAGAVDYPDERKYSIRLSIGAKGTDTLEILLGHLRSIAPGLRQKVLDVTCARGACVDVDTWTDPATPREVRDLGIAVAAGEPLAEPQVLARPSSSGKPGYFQGSGVVRSPWAQMEFYVMGRGETFCFFDLVDPAIKAAAQASLTAAMLDPSNPRYGAAQRSKWQWRAEGRTCLARSTFPMDSSALTTNLGGWWKRPPPAGDGDELLAFAPFAKDVPAYDPALYTTPQIDTLLVRQRSSAAPPFVVPSPAGPWQVPRLEGEILDPTPTTLLVRWRDVQTNPGSFDVYQRAAFALRPDGLAMRWGPFATSAATATAPALSDADACGAPGVDCYGHDQLPGW
jgi:hypothetical protein